MYDTALMSEWPNCLVEIWQVNTCIQRLCMCIWLQEQKRCGALSGSVTVGAINGKGIAVSSCIADKVIQAAVLLISYFG